MIMEGPESGILPDIAYGIFEIFLNKGLKARGSFLFELVEQRLDFKDSFNDIFIEFEKEYPPLAQTILMKFGDTNFIYQMLCSGEGVTPSITTQMYFITQDAPNVEQSDMDNEFAGKWLIFVDSQSVDEAWRKICNATRIGYLGISAKVSTAKPNPESRDNRKVIFVYTRDWRDEADVMRVRERLREMGFVERLGYKRNIETYRGEYSKKGKRVTYYSA